VVLLVKFSGPASGTADAFDANTWDGSR